jgi:hypothetical protein
VSLIFDALRKLEREKDAREPGVVVVGAVPWGGGRSGRRPALVLAAAGLVAVAVVGWWRLRPTPPPTTAPAAVASPSPSPSAPSPEAPDVAASKVVPAPVPPPRRPAVPPSSEAPAEGNAPAETPPATAAAHPATAVEPPGAPADLRLNAISQRDGRPVALVNDRLVFEGDSFDGVTIVRIGEAEVEVEIRGRRRVLRF